MEIALFRTPFSTRECLDIILPEQIKAIDNCRSSYIDFELVGVCDWRGGGKNALAFCPVLDQEKIEEKLEHCIIFTESFPEQPSSKNIYLTIADARAAFIDALSMITNKYGFHPYTSSMINTPKVSGKATISAHTIIEDGVDIADGVTIGAGCIIKTGTQIGKNTIIRENTIIGIDGITIYKTKDGRILRFPHVCGAVVGENTEIGASCVIPRGILSSTRIGNNVVLGNLCNIGHGAMLSDRIWASVGTLVGGHTRIEEGATIGMGVRVKDNLFIGRRALIGMGSVVVKDVEAESSVFGNPARRTATLSCGPER
jgi:UDP-3-O-[3-hydroxymyristoyl] glucosamine N-acyltransferase